MLGTDASNIGVGAALAQVQDRELVILQFAARNLIPAERKWGGREREAFAIKWSVQRFSDYIKSGRTLVLTDHESLRWMWGSKSGKVQRWPLYLQIWSWHTKGMRKTTWQTGSREVWTTIRELTGMWKNLRYRILCCKRSRRLTRRTARERNKRGSRQGDGDVAASYPLDRGRTF